MSHDQEGTAHDIERAAEQVRHELARMRHFYEKALGEVEMDLLAELGENLDAEEIHSVRQRLLRLRNDRVRARDAAKHGHAFARIIVGYAANLHSSLHAETANDLSVAAE